jgi:hypothetical protein
MGSICAEKALYGSDAAITNLAKSGRASGSALREMQTVSCDFIFGAVRSSAVQDRSGYKRRITVAPLCRIDPGTQVVPLREPARIIVGKPCFACGILPNQCLQPQIYSDRLV